MTGNAMRDKTVVITGAAGGIGTALAHRFAREGAHLGLLDREAGAVAALGAEIDDSGSRVMAAHCDVTSAGDCSTAIADIVRKFGGVDILVNNAGITQLGGVRETDIDVLRTVMDVNFFGAVNCTKAALESLLARRGQVVTVSSVAGIAPLATRAGYSASKHALHGFFDSLRAEHRRDGLRVMIVCPSFVDTRIGDHALGPHGGDAPAGTRSGVRNPSTPEELADAVVRAAIANRRLLLFPREAVAAYWMARLAPSMYERLMLRRTLGPDRA
jgi:NAD(P)-dependent dehydrogenase (short-subunit alcohol dehydrogenase family)